MVSVINLQCDGVSEVSDYKNTEDTSHPSPFNLTEWSGLLLCIDFFLLIFGIKLSTGWKDNYANVEMGGDRLGFREKTPSLALSVVETVQRPSSFVTRGTTFKN